MTEKTIVQCLAAVMEGVRAVGKGDRNSAQNYSFRGIDAVVNAVGPVLRQHGVVVVPAVEDVHYRDVQTSNGKASRECTVRVKYTFYGPAGDHIDCVTIGESLDFGDKGAPKAMSVAFRIALLQALCLPTTDTDPDAQQYERGHQAAQRGQDQYSTNMPAGGRGEQPRNGAPATDPRSSNGRPAQRQPAQEQPAEQPPDPAAEKARADLRAKVEAAGVDGHALAAKFEQQYGESLKLCRDATRITAFTKLQNLSTASRVGASQ